jgi:hypothetical protein
MEDVEMLRQANEALAELDAKRGFPLKLIGIEKLSEPGVKDYYRLRFLGGSSITFFWRPGESFRRLVYEAAERDRFG